MSGLKLSNTYALLIAVNEYKSDLHSNLDGCIPDAKSVANYLTEDLHVPRENLLSLFNANATRQGILDAFRDHLILNDNIQPSDPIIVYFSGHGTRQPAPPEWHKGDEHAELILPHDADCQQPGDKNYTHGIPDRTLGRLIHRLRQAKGDNITVILDSCCSGGGTRGNVRVRSSDVPNARPIPPDLDDDFFQTLSPVPSADPKKVIDEQLGFSIPPALSDAPSLETHVLLAACKNTELAQEIPKPRAVGDESSKQEYSGLFTMQLLRALRGCDMETTSYSSLMKTVQTHAASLQFMLSKEFRQVKIQTPQCEGHKQDRLVFRTQFALSKGMIALEYNPSNNTYLINAGHSSGIQKGTEFGVYARNMPSTAKPVTRLVATHVDGAGSLLSPKEPNEGVEIPIDAYVVVVKYTGPGIRILLDDRLEIDPVWQDVFNKLDAQRIGIIWTDPGEVSDLVLVPTDQGVEVQRLDPSLVQLNPRKIILEKDLNANELARRLTSIVHFHFHLQRHNHKSPIAKGLVEMKLIELKTKTAYAWGGKDYIPVSNNPEDLFGDSLSTEKVAELHSTPEKRYGLQLSNKSNWPLFAWVVYFDLEDYSITFLYSPHSRNMTAPLTANGKTLPVGYGDSGTEPLRVDNSGFSNRETGVFMLFVSFQWLDISHIEQPSIYEPVADGDARANPGNVRPISYVWDIMTVGVSIQQ